MDTPRATSNADMRRWTPEEKAEIARRFAAGETVPQLCVAYGTTWNMVRKFLALHGAKRLRAGGRSYLRNLTDEEKAGIVLRYQAGESAPALREAFACSFQTIYRALRAAGIEARSNWSAALVASLERLGMRGRSLERVALPEFEDSDQFWGGICDGDGHIGWHGSPVLSLVGGEVLLGQFAAYLVRHGAGPAFVRKPHPNCWRVTISGDRALTAIERLYVGASAALERKAATAADILNR